jgi:polysaccharide transporter, PST family
MNGGGRPEPGSLTTRTVRAVLWVALFELLRGLLYAAIPALVAGFGSAADVGLAELVFATYYVVTPFVEAGSGAAVIQRSESSNAFLSTVFLTNATTGLAAALALWSGARLLTSAAGFDPRLAPLLEGLAPCLVMIGLTVVPQSLLARRMAFGRLTAINVVAVAGTATAMVLAVQRGLGARAVVIALVVYSAIGMLGTWAAARWRPSWAFERRELGALFRFSVPNAGARLIGDFAAQLERFLIGAWMGSATLGLYGAVRGLARTPFLQLMQVSDRVLLPALSAQQHDLARTRAYYLSAVRNELAILGPLVVFTGATAAELVHLVYGPRWDAAIALMPLMAFITLRTCTNHSVGALLLAQGRPELQLLWSAINIPLMLCYFALGRPWGLPGFLAVWASVGILGWAIPHVVSCRVIGMRFRELLEGIAPVVLALAIAAALWRAALWALSGWIAARWRVAVLALPAFVTYAVVLWACDRVLVREAWQAIRSALPGSNRRTALG